METLDEDCNPPRENNCFNPADHQPVPGLKYFSHESCETRSGRQTDDQTLPNNKELKFNLQQATTNQHTINNKESQSSFRTYLNQSLQQGHRNQFTEHRNQATQYSIFSEFERKENPRPIQYNEPRCTCDYLSNPKSHCTPTMVQKPGCPVSFGYSHQEYCPFNENCHQCANPQCPNRCSLRHSYPSQHCFSHTCDYRMPRQPNSFWNSIRNFFKDITHMF